MKKKYWELNHPAVRILQHLAFWVLSFIIFLNLFKMGDKPEKVDYIYTALFQSSLLPAVYLNLKLLLPKLGTRRRMLPYIVSLAAVVIFFAWLNFNFFDKWSVNVFSDYFFISYFTFKEIIFFFTVYIVITTLLKLSKSWFLVSELQKELLEKDKQKTEVELKALKAQINPHFFFNTLNSIYSMALDKDERLPKTVLQLSDLMRYFLYVSRDRFIPLEKELEVVNDYIALQKIRSGEQLSIHVQRSGDVNGLRIAPLILITFLENAFKHSDKGNTERSFIRVGVAIESNELHFSVENSKGIIDDFKKGEYGGLGLENIKRQLELLYPGKHDLSIKNKENSFDVHLQLNL